MKLFEIKIGDKSYEFINSIHYNGKNYVAYKDKKTIYINEFIINEKDINFLEIDEQTFEDVKKAMAL
ncbi:MAG: hypothetical protein K5666_03660 [Bacilli bacterium]|jgi:hypothetical protein|nr:hypothetical protein [Bacilli bacterium]